MSIAQLLKVLKHPQWIHEVILIRNLIRVNSVCKEKKTTSKPVKTSSGVLIHVYQF